VLKDSKQGCDGDDQQNKGKQAIAKLNVFMESLGLL
jgi:hypothetical protein